MALNKPIPALADAQRAAACDPSNWKAHWRTGLALMMMAPRLERSEQAIAAFERTCACPTLPESEKQNTKEALNRAKYRLEQGKDALDMPDMSSTLPAPLIVPACATDTFSASSRHSSAPCLMTYLLACSSSQTASSLERPLVLGYRCTCFTATSQPKPAGAYAFVGAPFE
jgi:hypothetical protein